MAKNRFCGYELAKPFVLPLQIFRNTKNNTLFQKVRTKLAVSEHYWRLPSSPIVKKNMCVFYVVVVAVVVVVVVAVDMSENDAEDMSENDDDDVDVDVVNDADDDDVDDDGEGG